MKIKGAQKRGKIAVSLPLELDRQLRHEAIDRNCTCSEVVENALIDYFKRQDNLRTKSHDTNVVYELEIDQPG